MNSIEKAERFNTARINGKKYPVQWHKNNNCVIDAKGIEDKGTVQLTVE